MIGGVGVPGGRGGVNRLSGRMGLGLGECLVISLCVFRSGSSFCVHFLIVSSPSHCPMFATCCIPTSHRLHAENQTKTNPRRIRAHGAYAAELLDLIFQLFRDQLVRWSTPRLYSRPVFMRWSNVTEKPASPTHLPTHTQSESGDTTRVLIQAMIPSRQYVLTLYASVTSQLDSFLNKIVWRTRKYICMRVSYMITHLSRTLLWRNCQW